jgi:hypothetical protein
MYKDLAEAGLKQAPPNVPDWYWNPYLDPKLDAEAVAYYWNKDASNAQDRAIRSSNARGYYSGRRYYGGGYSSRSQVQARNIENWYSTLINWVIP